MEHTKPSSDLPQDRWGTSPGFSTEESSAPVAPHHGNGINPVQRIGNRKELCHSSNTGLLFLSIGCKMPSPMPTTLQLCTISFCLCCQQDTRERNRYQSRYPKSRSITPSHTAFSLVLHYAQFKLSCSTLQFYYVHSHTMLLYQQW